MKTSITITPSINKNSYVSFKGHTAYSTDKGLTGHKFYLPYDSNKYSATLELCGFEEENGIWQKIEDSNVLTYEMGPEGISIPEKYLFTEKGTATGYRFKLTEKNNPNNSFYKIDSGLQTNPNAKTPNDTYSLILPNRAVLTINGLTKQVMPDICLPGYYLDPQTKKPVFNPIERQRAINAVRTHGNKLGGNFAGIIKMLPTWSREGYTKIVGTPYTRDTTSSHYYWTENPYQVDKGLGTLDDFKTLQIELFKNGINFIADGAFVNQGLQGTIFQNVLKHGAQSPFINWFKASGILSSDLKLGLIPANPQARKNFRFRLVNSPNILIEENGKLKFDSNRDYDAKKPTFIQLYDKRLVTNKELADTTKLLERYSIPNTENAYDITGHNDITQLIAFQINPKTFENNVKKVKKNFSSKELTFNNTKLIEALLSFENFKIKTKDKGGFDLWDGNMDIAKLNFYIGNTDQAYLNKFTDIDEKKQKTKDIIAATYQVQDFALKSAQYWTRLVANTQTEFAANTLKDAIKSENTVQPQLSLVDRFKQVIAEQVELGNLPKRTKEVMTDKVIQNVISNKYVFNNLNTMEFIKWRKPYIQSQIMDFPLESIDFAPDLTAVLASPYITKRGTTEGDIFKKRHEMYVERDINEGPAPTKYSNVYNKTDDVINNEFTNYIEDLLTWVDFRMPNNQKIFKHRSLEITDYGKFVISFLMPDLMKYGMVKALNPKAKITIDPINQKIDYSQAKVDQISLKSIGAEGSPEIEAQKTIQKLQKGLKNIFNGKEEEKETLIRYIVNRIKDTNEVSVKMAAAIVDQTESGLGWRIDAAKDIANIDAIRTGNDNDDELFSAVIDFWSKFKNVVTKENKHAFTTAEITDLQTVIKNPNGKFHDEINAETKFIEKTGLNNTANYMFFYSMLKDLFANNSEDGNANEFNNIHNIPNKLIHGWSGKCHGFLFQYPDDSISNSYTFVGNHDKPRVLHIFGLDMALFHSDFENKEHLNRARRVLNLGYDEQVSIKTISSKAVAMGERIIYALECIGATLTDAEFEHADYLKQKNSKILRNAIANLVKGQFKGKKFNPDAFGTRDFKHAIQHVFEEAKYLGYNSDKIKEYEAKALQNILEPAMDKMETVYKMLVTLPGSPTDFVGDKEGSSGYETKSNNDFQQNRNAVPFEWVNNTIQNNDLGFKENKDFVNAYYKRMTAIGSLRNRKELSALNNGHTISLPIQTAQDGSKVAATFRYNDKGSQVICLYTTQGAQLDNYHVMNRPNAVNLDRIVLDDFNWKEGIKGGLKEGEIFKKVGDNEGIYKVVIEDNKYKLKREDSTGFNAISILNSDKNTAVFYKVNPQKYEPKLIFPNMIPLYK